MFHSRVTDTPETPQVPPQPNLNSAVLAEADMGREDIQHIKFYVTDIDAAMANMDVMIDYLGENRPPQSLIGVSALALPELMIEVEAIGIK